jgi:hypothetical protein
MSSETTSRSSHLRLSRRKGLTSPEQVPKRRDHASGAQPMGAGLFIRADYNFLFRLRFGFAEVKTYIELYA